MSKLVWDEFISLEVLIKVYTELKVDIGDVMEIDPITKSEVKITTEELNKR